MQISELTKFKCAICNTFLFEFNLKKSKALYDTTHYGCSNNCCGIIVKRNKICSFVYFVNYNQTQFKFIMEDIVVLINNDLNINNEIKCDLFSLTKEQMFKIIKSTLNSRILE